MSLLEALDDDIADLLGSDNDEETYKKHVSKGQQYKEKIRNLRQKNDSKTEKNNENRNSKSEKKSLIDTKHNINRRKMLQSQSNQSLPSTTNTISHQKQSPMSKEEALSLLQSESNSKLLASTASTNKLNTNDDSNHFDFPSASSPISQDKSRQSPNKSHKNESLSTSDDDSNDSILDWLDEPRVKPQNKRQLLLPKKKTALAFPIETTESESAQVTEKTVTKKHVTTNHIEEWKEWLGLDVNKKEDKEFIYLAETAAKTPLPDHWERVNDNLYHNIKTDERTMNHPLLESIRNELKVLRNKKKEENTTDIPLRQISDDTECFTKTEQTLVPNPIKKEKTTMQNQEMNHYKEESESLIIQNLRMELNETRKKYNNLLKEKTCLMEEIEETNNKTEILLNEQRVRLNQSHKMEQSQLQKEKDDLRALNSKLMNEHQTELINLEENIRKNGLTQKQRTMNEMQLVEERARKELMHQIELNRGKVDELKKQHLNEIETLNNMHSKQLQNFRKQNKNEGQLNVLITKMETSTANLNRLQKDIFNERECNQKERETKISEKERILNEKDDELIRERAAHRELLQRFQTLVQETKLEKSRLRQNEDKLTDNNREINIQRDILNEERRKFEINKNRWNKQKEDELNDIQRLKNDHTQSIKTFYEEQEIERTRFAKQRQIISDDKSRFIQIKKEFDVERDAFDTIKLEFEQNKHNLGIEKTKFERKVESITSLSHRVCQQSELVKKMYNDSKQIEHQNIVETKQLKMIKQQILIEKNQTENERKMLEEEQLSLLTTKRDLLQQIDSIHHIKTMNMNMNMNINTNTNTNINTSSQKQYQTTKKSINKNHNLSINKINCELKELKDFVNQCKHNISNYKTDLNNLKYKRESIKSLSSTNHCSHFNPLRMSFPSFSTKSYNNNKTNKSQNDSINTINLSKIEIQTQTPIIPKRIRNNNLNALNNTESTLQSSFVSMVNIDTPITIDNKTKKYMNKIKEKDPTLPMTPIPMPNISKINITEEDNNDLHYSDGVDQGDTS